MSTLGDRLKLRRIEFGYAQHQLGERINVQQSQISAYEEERVYPSIPIFMKICKELNLSADYVLFGHENVDKTELPHINDPELIKLFQKIDVLQEPDLTTLKRTIEVFILKSTMEQSGKRILE